LSKYLVPLTVCIEKTAMYGFLGVKVDHRYENVEKIFLLDWFSESNLDCD
jgi:hypothetical protein